jgi:seryl-tRNA synthetase
MLDINFIRNNIELVKETVINKNGALNVDLLLETDHKRRQLISEIGAFRAQRNEISEIMKDPAKRQENLTLQGKALKELITEKEKDLQKVDETFHQLMYLTPTIPSSDTPIGKDSGGNVEVKRFGEIPTFAFPPLDHIELGKKNHWIDIERGVKVAGFRGYFLKNEGALLQMRLMSYVFQKLAQKGYTPIIPPTLVKEAALWGTGYFPFGIGENYEIANVSEEESGKLMSDKLFLAGTAEVGIGAFFKDEILKEEELPLRFVGFSPCFRREVGSYGRDTKGLYRIHEFMKVEQFILCKNDYSISETLHQELLKNSEEILQELRIPYRVIQLCTGDMGIGKYKMFDIESWMPSRNAFGETHSCSNLGEWQARRLNIRYQAKGGTLQYVHTLNNTAIASPRILISIMEINQDNEGHILIPEVIK